MTNTESHTSDKRVVWSRASLVGAMAGGPTAGFWEIQTHKRFQRTPI